MVLIKKIILFSLFMFSISSRLAFAQSDADNETPTLTAESSDADSTSAVTAAVAKKTTVKSLTTSAIGVSTIQWNEPLILQQAGKSERDVANYSGLALSYQKETIYYHWGWAFGGLLGTGRANGGGNAASIAYQKDHQSFTLIGLNPRVFYRLTGKVNLGVTGLAYYRSVMWPTDSAGLTVNATRNFTLTALADVNLRITDRFDFYQGLGPLDTGATFWKVGFSYRMK